MEIRHDGESHYSLAQLQGAAHKTILAPRPGVVRKVRQMKMTFTVFKIFRTSLRAFHLSLILQLMIVMIAIIAEGQSIMAETKGVPKDDLKKAETDPNSTPDRLEQATFGSGCFWCTEAVFQQLKGVKSCVSGYSGGRTKNPTYSQVSTGNTGHAEVIQVTFDPKIVTYIDLLEVFWKTHDPTTLNRQGADHGTQYRSVIFYHNEAQQKLASEYLKKLDKSGSFDAPIVTEVAPFKEFYPGEEYHQNYFLNNPADRYCTAVIKRKVAKFKEVFKDKLKP